jgi:hypothetical protein
MSQDLAGLAAKVHERGLGEVEGKVVMGVSGAVGFERGVRLRDVDGHFLMVVGK